MNKEMFLCRLRAIMREITCMRDSTFDERFGNGIMEFVYFICGESAKITTKIEMKKIELV